MSSQVIAIDGPAGSGKSTRGPRARRGARLVVPRHRRDVPRGHRRGAAPGRRPRSTTTRSRESPRGPTSTTLPRVTVNGRDVERRAAHRRGQRGGLGRRGQSRACAPHGRAPARLRRRPAARHGRRGPRHHDGRLSRRDGQGLPDGVARGAGAAPRRRGRGVRRATRRRSTRRARVAAAPGGRRPRARHDGTRRSRTSSRRSSRA